MARVKALQISAAHPESCVIGADTVVALDRIIFGKPSDRQEALTTLKILQGKTHQVTTAFAVVMQQRAIEEVVTSTTLVTFDIFADDILQAYIDTEEPMDKAGAYGIQGKGTFLIRSITGSYSNVVGLPLHAVVQVLLQHQLLKPR
jgi:septum formation protein